VRVGIDIEKEKETPYAPPSYKPKIQFPQRLVKSKIG